MPVTLELPTEFARYTDGQSVVSLNGTTIGEILDDLFSQYPDLTIRVRGTQGELYSYMPLFMNGEKVPSHNYHSIPVAADDRLEIVPLASGG